MLIYNSKKEFLGIDEGDLQNLGYSSFTQLRSEAADFADLFVKTPGFIHNFKHVHWIDFITCADSAEIPKVIIHANGKNYKSNLHISTAYLTDNSSAKAYLVTLQNLRELTGSETNDFASDISKEVASRPTELIVEDTPIVSTTSTVDEKTVVAPVTPVAPITPTVPLTPKPETIEVQNNIIEDEYDTPLSAPLDISFDNHEEEKTLQPIELDEEIETKIEDKIAPAIEIEPEIEPILNIEDDIQASSQEEALNEVPEEAYTSDYVYDPQIASSELGLPIDLIEEFIDDFIAQAKEFKEKLYEALDEEDIQEVKTLSHKLKGVAANLRIEDAFEVLTTINTADNLDIIRKNLNHLYIIVAKLSGETIQVPTMQAASKPAPIIEEIEEETEEEELVLDFKDDTLSAETPTLLEKEEEALEVSLQDEEIELQIEEPIIEESVEETPQEKLDIPSEDEEITLEIEDIDVPSKIDIPQLADDDFLNNEPVEIDEKSLDLDIETVDEVALSKETSNIDELPALDEVNVEDEITPQTDTTDVLELDESVFDSEVQYNKTEVANEIGLDVETFQELYDDYLTDAEYLSVAIDNAIEVNDVDTWKNEAIKLKGMSDNMRIHVFTNELETLLNTDDQDQALESIQQIKILLSKLSTLEA